MSTLQRRVEALEAKVTPTEKQRLEEGWIACWRYSRNKVKGLEAVPPTEEQKAAFNWLAENSAPHREYLENIKKVYGPIARKRQEDAERAKSA